MDINEISDHAEYVGDGVYLVGKGYDGYHVWLVTTDGVTVQNKIALDTHTLHTLFRMLEQITGE